MTDSVSRQHLPVPLNYRQLDRAQVLAQLIGDLVQPAHPENRLNTKSLSDPSVALLDGWATVADVIDFYQERIAAESYLQTATEPESVLALASLLGYRPRPGLAATCWLAYTLVADPTDTAVLLPQHQVVQSVPAAGQLPQTFETSEDFVARPSWNTLPVKTTAPLQIVKDNTDASAADHYLTPPQLIIAGAAPQVDPSDVVLITPDDQLDHRLIVRVQDVQPDLMANTTTLVAQQPFNTAAAPLVASQQDGPPVDLVAAMSGLVKPLTTPPSAPRATQTAVRRDPTRLFPGSGRQLGQLPDISAKLLAALHPGLSRALYPALASSAIGQPQIDAVQALRATTAPFGIQIPPRPRFDRHGQPQPPEEWPIDQTQTVRIVIDDFDQATPPVDVTNAAVHLETPTEAGNAQITDGAQTSTAGIDISINQQQTNTIEFKPEPGQTAIEHLSVTVDNTNQIVTVTNNTSQATVSASLTDAKLAGNIAANLPAPSAASQGLFLRLEFLPTTATIAAVGRALSTPPPSGQFVIDIVSALPLANRTVLDLNERHDEIVAGSYIMVEQPPPKTGPARPEVAILDPNADEPSYPLVAKAVTASAVAVNRYGMSLTVTRLQLDTTWLSSTARLLSELRPLTVHARSVALDLLQVPFTPDVATGQIEVDGLHPGLDTGHRLVLTGTRTDVPGATVQAGEAVMVSGVTQTSDPGAAPYTTLQLDKPLSYSYRRDTVTLYGNVVPAHHGTTITEPLTATGDPAHPAFTLAQSPVLADPATGQAGFTSSLTLVVDGRTWTWVPRLDDTTPARCYTTGTDSQSHTTITLGQPLPHPASTVTATYRAGTGSAGNLAAAQLTQPLTRPLAVATVTNPLPTSGGADPDGPDIVRTHAPRGLAALGRVVSVQDTADIALTWAGIGKTAASEGNDAQRDVVTVTIAGASPDPLAKDSTLITDLGAALTAAGDVTMPIEVNPAQISLIVLLAKIGHDPDLSWDTVEPAVRAELTDAYGYDHRDIDEDIIISDLIAVIHRVDGVRSCAITGIGLIPPAAAANDLADFSPANPDGGQVPVAGGLAITITDGRIPVTGVSYLSGAVADTLILKEA